MKIAESKEAETARKRAEHFGVELMSVEPESWWDENERPTEHDIELSKAISAKRQADAIERIADAFYQKTETGNVLYWLEQIASAANAGRS